MGILFFALPPIVLATVVSFCIVRVIDEPPIKVFSLMSAVAAQMLVAPITFCITQFLALPRLWPSDAFYLRVMVHVGWAM